MSENRTCPMCKEIIPDDAFVCGKCLSVLVPGEYQDLCLFFRGATQAVGVARWNTLTEQQQIDTMRAWAAFKMGPFPRMVAPTPPPPEQLRAGSGSRTILGVFGWFGALVLGTMAVASTDFVAGLALYLIVTLGVVLWVAMDLTITKQRAPTLPMSTPAWLVANLIAWPLAMPIFLQQKTARLKEVADSDLVA